MVHVAVNKYDFEKINILEYAFGEGGGGHQKAYAVYAFINVDNCERPLSMPLVAGLIPGPGSWHVVIRLKTWLSNCYIRDCESLCLSDETLKAVGPFYLVSMPGEVKDPTSLHWKCITCRGLHIVA